MVTTTPLFFLWTGPAVLLTSPIVYEETFHLEVILRLILLPLVSITYPFQAFSSYCRFLPLLKGRDLASLS